jgi:replicative DNA helicase
MTDAEPRRSLTRGRLRAVPEPDRQPPHNLEAEEAVLGAILTAGRLLAEVAAVLEEVDFYRPAHRAIWRAILRLADRDEPTDPVTVLGELDDSGDLADVGGAPFLHTLIEAVPTVANAGHYAQLVADTARRRRVIDLGIRLAHSDADPAVLVHLAGELADTTTGLDGRGWAPPIPFGRTGELPPFPVEVLPSWLGEYAAAVATATQTPPDLAGMLALAVLASVAAGAVEVEPRPGWREPLCLFVAVGMDAGTRKSSVFTALTQPVAEFERQQAAAALPAITETATLRRIADKAAAAAEAAASKAPIDQQEERQAEAIARAAEAANLVVPPVPRWLVDDATPEALAGLLATYGRIALLSPEGDVFDQMAGRYNQAAGPNLGVYLKGHAGDLLKVDRRGRPPEYVERPCLTIGLTVQPEVLQGLASRPGFKGRGLLARFLYSLPASLVGHRQAGAPPIPEPVADRYTLELQALAASFTAPASEDRPAVLALNQEAAALLLAFERELEPRLAAGSGDLAHLAGWAAKLAGATCRLAALLHLASHLRDGWAHPIGGDTLTRAIWLADYLIEHACAVFDLMGADPRLDDARWLLDWIGRTNRTQFTRRDAHKAAPRGRFPKATDLEPALSLLQEHGYLRRVDPEPSRDPHGRGRPASPRFLVNPLPRATEQQKRQKLSPELFLWILSFLWRVATPRGAADEGEILCHVIQRERPQPILAISRHTSDRLLLPEAQEGRPPRRSLPTTVSRWPPAGANATNPR